MKRKMIEKLTDIEKKLADERGSFALFGVFLREGSPNRWEIVVSAPWLDEHSRESLEFIIKSIHPNFELQEWIMMATVILLDPSQEFVKEVNEEVNVEHGNVRIMGYEFNGMEIKRAHIITSKPDAA